MDSHQTCQADNSTPRLLLIIGFTENILYTARITFWDISVPSER